MEGPAAISIRRVAAMPRDTSLCTPKGKRVAETQLDSDSSPGASSSSTPPNMLCIKRQCPGLQPPMRGREADALPETQDEYEQSYTDYIVESERKHMEMMEACNDSPPPPAVRLREKQRHRRRCREKLRGSLLHYCPLFRLLIRLCGKVPKKHDASMLRRRPEQGGRTISPTTTPSGLPTRTGLSLVVRCGKRLPPSTWPMLELIHT